ncbi:MAG: glycosyltransferase family 2 protein [Pseudomonadota bacterium]
MADHGLGLAETATISVVVPVYNERESLAALWSEIDAVLGARAPWFEVIFVDDGSTDGSLDVLRGLHAGHPDKIRIIEFRRNFGKAAGLDAGFRQARGDVVFTMDADLQDDPAEIPRFLVKLDEGFDLVSGWKEVRHDPLGKTLPSRVFNTVVSKVGGLMLNDFNCGFKAYRRGAVETLDLYGELHRFVPVLLHWKGFRVGEIAVNHRARKFGQSKYGFGRLFKGALDLMGVVLNTRFASRPLHVFGGVGIAMGATGFAILAYLTALWFMGLGPIGDRPLLLLGMLLVMSSLQFFTIGMLGEFVQRQNARARPGYLIRSDTGDAPANAIDLQVARLEAAAAALKEARAEWTPQQPPSATTPPNAISGNTPTATRSSG